MKREDIIALIEEIGVFPGIRVKSGDQAFYAAETLYRAGIPVAEITMTVPGGIEAIRQLAQKYPKMAVGAGTVLDEETAKRCGLRPKTLYEWKRLGKLRAEHGLRLIGRKVMLEWLIFKACLDRDEFARCS